jgi:hypothetical protein
MRKPDQDEILANIFADENLDTLREATLASGLTSIRQRRQRRRRIEMAATLAVAVLVILAATVPWSAKSPTQLARQSAPMSPTAMPAPQAPAPKIQYINQQELFALFPNRSIALIGKPGHQQLIFLDQLAQQDGR